MPEYAEPRAGYDVSELMWIRETSFKTLPQAGDWNHFGDPISIAPSPLKEYRERVGLGRQIASGFTIVKEWVEPVIEYDILAKDATNSYEWIESLAGILGADVAASTIDLEKRIMPFSLGAKMTLSDYDTFDDEYWTFIGCKRNELELYSAEDETVHVRESLIGIGAATYNTTDYMQGTATRETFPTTEPIVNGDCDLEISGSSIMPEAINWALRIRRNLEKHGSQSGAGTLYNRLIEGKCEAELEVVMDFESTTELTQFMNESKIYANLKIPSASGGRNIALSTSGDAQGVWRTMRKPARELDLINLTLVSTYDTIAVSTIV